MKDLLDYLIAVFISLTSIISNPNYINRTTTPSPKETVLAEGTQQSSSNLVKFIYPGAKVNSSTATKLDLSSSDDPNSILSWYSQQFSHGYSQNNVTNSNTNGNVNAHIQVSNNIESFEVQLNKNRTELYTHIIVESK